MYLLLRAIYQVWSEKLNAENCNRFIANYIDKTLRKELMEMSKWKVNGSM